MLIITVALYLADIATCQSQTMVKGLEPVTLSHGNLSLSIPYNVELNDICPGCEKSWSCDSQCMQWEVSTTKTSQRFRVVFTNPSNASTYNLDWEWEFQDDNSGHWKSFNDPKFPTGAYDHPNNVFTVESSRFQCIEVIKFRVCVKGMQTQCNQNPGTVNLGFNVLVSCY